MSLHGPYLILTHAGLNNASVLVSDVQVLGAGLSQGFPTARPVYVPTGGSIEIPYTSSVALSYEMGAIRGFIDAGYITAEFHIGDDAWHGVLSSRSGWVNIDDAATAATPLVLVANTWTQMPCDGLAATTVTTYGPTSVGTIWNTTTNEFSFADLHVGDVVEVRVNLMITPLQNDSTFELRLYFPAFGGFALTTGAPPFVGGAGVAYDRIIETSFYIGSEDVRQMGALVEVRCSCDAEVVVRGLFIRFPYLR